MVEIIQHVKDSILPELREEFSAEMRQEIDAISEELRAELIQEIKAMRAELLSEFLSSLGESTPDAFRQVSHTFSGDHALRESMGDDVISIQSPSIPPPSLSAGTSTMTEIIQQVKDSILPELRKELRAELRHEMEVMKVELLFELERSNEIPRSTYILSYVSYIHVYLHKFDIIYEFVCYVYI